MVLEHVANYAHYRRNSLVQAYDNSVCGLV
eukprot:COSAG04_NODE_32232_length_252_cov_0.679739_2_plen_29_part_01